MGRHSAPEDNAARGGYPRSQVARATEVLEHQQKEGPGHPATPNTVARAATWAARKLTTTPEAKAWLTEQSKRTDHDWGSAGDCVRVAEVLLVEALDEGDVDRTDAAHIMLKIADTWRKIGDSERARTAGPSAHGAAVQVNIVFNGVDGEAPFSDTGPGDLLQVG